MSFDIDQFASAKPAAPEVADVNVKESLTVVKRDDAPDLKHGRRRRPAEEPKILDRLPPHSVEAEQGVLGCIMLSPNDSMPDCISKLKPDSFYDLRHQSIYESMLALYDTQVSIDTITLQEHLKSKQLLEAVGGIAYLATLPETVPSAANLAFYLDIVCEKKMLRSMLRACTEAAGRIYDFEGEASELIDEVEAKILSMRTVANTGIYTGKEMARAAISRIEDIWARQGAISGLPTGFRDLDKKIQGMHPGEMIVIAARPSKGKTSLAMNIAENVCAAGIPVHVFSMEMTAADLATRMVTSMARVNLRGIQDGFIKESDFPKLSIASSKLAGYPLFIDDTSALSIMDLRARARRSAQQNGIELVVIDYLQLMHTTNRKADSRQLEIADISGGIKALAKELNIPVIAVCQLNRDMEKEKRKPRLSDLRESGCLAGDTIIYGRNHQSRIDELSIDADRDLEIYSAMSNKIVVSKANRVWKSGRKTVFEMVLTTGHRIKATGNHKFLAFGSQWVPLEKLTIGDQIAIPLNAPLPSKATITMAEARLLGLLVSNGCTIPLRSTQLTLNSLDMDLKRMAISDAKEIFAGALRPYSVNERPKTRPGHGWTQVFFPSKRVPSKKRRSDMSLWLQKHGLLGQRAKTKSVPPEMFNQPKAVISEFLSALFSGDGTTGLYHHPNGRKHRYTVAAYSSSSRKLVDGVQWLLQCIGIVSGISTVKCRGFTNHTLQVYSRTSRILFASTVGFLCRRKQKTMQRVVKALLAAPRGWEKYIPDGDLAFVPIKSINRMGVQDVWDAQVPNTHNLIANSIIVHNSLEQDADVVGLLYSPTEGEENCAAQPINLLIAKQRNGPTGDVPLTFMRYWTRFESAAKVEESDVPENQTPYSD